MPFALIIVGLALLISGVRNTQSDLFTLVKGDFVGQGNFVFWFVALFAVGSLGYFKTIRPISDAFLALVIIGLILSHKGFFSQLSAQLNTTKTDSVSPAGKTTGGLPPLPAIPQLGSLFGGH